MSETITCRVTAEHIKHGVPHNPLNCPIALALRAQVGDDTEVSVGFIDVVVGDKEYKPSRAAKVFIDAFDWNQNVSPATFRFRRVE